MSSDQPCFPGFESYFTPEPLPRGTYLVVDLLKWYRDNAAGGLCWAFQRTIAAKLHRSVRWLNDRLQALVRCGALKITHRGPHSCFYQLAEHFAELLGAHLITESTSESKPLVTEPIRTSEVSEAKPEPEKPSPPTPTRPLLQTGLITSAPQADRFQEYIGVFLAARKPITQMRIEWAFRMWISVEPSILEQQELITAAVTACTEASSGKYCPDPAAWLRRNRDGRLDIPRVLPGESNLKPQSKWDKINRGMIESAERLIAKFGGNK